MKTADIRKKKPEDRAKLLAELESELRAFRFGMSGSHTKNVRKARALRKDIARLKTVMHEN